MSGKIKGGNVLLDDNTGSSVNVFVSANGELLQNCRAENFNKKKKNKKKLYNNFERYFIAMFFFFNKIV